MANRIPRPTCRRANCKRRPRRWAPYERTDARLADGSRLAPIPIQRHRCPEHGEATQVPACLCKYLHYLPEVVQECTDQYAGSNRPVAAILDEDGPAVITIWRWIDGLLLDNAVRGWAEEKLQGLKADWKEGVLPEVSARWPRPPTARSEPWSRVQMARCLSIVSSAEAIVRPAKLFYVTLLQIGRLLNLRSCNLA